MERLRPKDLLEYFHYESIRKNDDIALKIIGEYEEKLGITYNFICASPFDKESEMLKHVSQLISLMRGIPITSERGKILYDLLCKHNYNFLLDIRETIGDLGNLSDPNNNKEVIDAALNSSVIDDISFNSKDTFKIFSEQYGNFEFLLAREYYKDNQKLISYMNENKLLGHCHRNTEEMSFLFPDFYSITSLLVSFFEGFYYHSYSYNREEDTVVDLCSNAIFTNECFNRLMEPTEIMRVKNSKISKYYKKVNKNTQDISNWSIIFRTALYMQLKNMKRIEKKALTKELNIRK